MNYDFLKKKKLKNFLNLLSIESKPKLHQRHNFLYISFCNNSKKTYFLNYSSKKNEIQKTFSKVSIWSSFSLPVSSFESCFFKTSRVNSSYYFFETALTNSANFFYSKKSKTYKNSNQSNLKLFAFNQNLPEFRKSNVISNTLPSLHSLNTLLLRKPVSFLSKKKTITKNINKNQDNFVKESTIQKTSEILSNSNLLTEEKNFMSFPNIKQKTKFYTSYSKLSEIKLLTIGLASPLRILQWAEKTLPNGKIYGEVLNANTLHHKTFKPQKGGLFCERIFGPLKDFECACGKINKATKKLQTASFNNMEDSQILNDNKIEQKFKTNLNRKFCPDCDVEYTWSVIRRYQLGYIKLCSPVTHIWFLKGTPSYLSLLLDIKKRFLQFVTYCSEILTIEKSSIPLYSLNLFSNARIDINSNETSILLDSGINNTYAANKHWHNNVTLQNTLEKQTLLNLKEDFFEKNSSNLYTFITLLNEKNNKTLKIIKPKKIAYFLLKKKSNKKSLYIIPNSNEQKLPIYFVKNVRNSPNFFCFICEENKKEKKNEINKSQLDKTFISLLNNLNIRKLTSSSFYWHHIPICLQNNNKQIKEGTAIISLLLLNLYIKNFDFNNLSKNKVITSHLKKSLQNKAIVDKHKNVAFFIIDKAKNNNKRSLFFGKRTSFLIFEKIYKGSSFTHKQTQTNEVLLLFPNITSLPKAIITANCNTQQEVHHVNNVNNVVSSINKTNSFLKNLPNIKNILKKLPLDLYILCLLEPMLHKSSLTLAINNTWHFLYKQAFINAIYKAKNIFYKFLISLKAKKQIKLFNYNLINEVHNLNLGSNLVSKQKLKFLKLILFIQNQQIENFVKKNQPNNKILKNLKNLYINHLYKLFENIPNEIMSLKYITSFLQKNDFLSIKNNFSLDIRNFLLKKTNFIQNILIKYFLNSFILDFYYLFIFNLFKHKQTSKTHIMSVIIAKQKKQKNNVNTNFLLSLQNYTNLKNIKKVNSIINQNYIIKLINGSNVHAVLNTYQNYLTFSFLFTIAYCKKKRSKQKLQKKQYLIFKEISNKMIHIRDNKDKDNFFYKEKEIKKIKKKKISEDYVTKSGINLGIGYGRLAGICNINWFFKKYKEKKNKKLLYFNLDNSLQYEKNYFLQIKQKQADYKTTKCLYNNIYTLSHRERWAIEKDWQIFTWFAFGPTNYFDFIIPKYKNRLFSLKNEEISSFTFSSNPSFNVDNNFVNNFNPNSQKDSLVNFSSSLKNNPNMLNSSFSNYSFFSGAGIIQQLLNEFDFYEIKKLDKQNRLILYQLNKSILKLKKQVQIFVYDKNSQIELRELCKKRDLLIRRTKLVRKLFRKNSNPTSMILNLIPVLPPDLRPIVKMGNQIAASDLNRLYQRVIYRNDRLKKFLKDAATSQSYEMKYAQRLLQEAVDNLLQNGKSGSNSEKDSRGRSLKSLSDILKGKQGRFRQFLLGKRVDYSGRSVIVVGPTLKLHECGLPFEMAKELYLPFLLKSLLNKNYAKTVVGAKTLIKNNSSLAHQLLREIMQVSPVLLNRAPTLHRLGFQAFVPKLIEGRAILLHPLVCSAFNADFDGDQMAVHVPITIEARAEAWKLMLSKNNLLSTATGDPLAIPSQDMVLGCYYLTTFSNHGKILKGSGMFFNSLQDVIKLYEQRIINIHSLIWVKWTNLIENSNEQQNHQSCEIRLSSFGQWQEINSNSYRIYDSYNNLINQYILTTPGRVLFNLIIQKIIS